MAKKTQEIWVLVITHRHGFNVYATTTELAAHQALYRYVKQEWAEMGSRRMPKDPAKAVDAYFEEMGNHANHSEVYRIEPCDLIEEEAA